MLPLSKALVLNTLIKHETLTLADIGKEENLGFVANQSHLGFILSELEHGSFIQRLDGAEECTYTITDKGIEEGRRHQSL